MLGMTRLLLILAMATLGFSSVTANAASMPVKEWTVLVYLNGHNNLDSYGYDDINEMEQVGSTDQTNVVVQWASAKDSKQTRRLFVQKDTNPKKVSSLVVDSLPTVDMGNYENLVEFVRWGMKNYPAKHYFVDIWNHGGGWHRRGVIQPQDISWDDISGNVITTEQLGVAMQEIRQFRGASVDILGFDACLMSMGEVLTQVEGSVDFVVGSQDTEPGAGWPYGAWLGGVEKLADANAANVLKVLTTEYVKSYTNGSQGNEEVTLSAFDLSYLSDFKNSVRGLTSLIRTIPANVQPAVQAVLKQTQSFYFNDYIDAGDFVVGLEKANLIDVRQIEVQSMKTALDRLVISNQTSPSFKRATGLSIWFPKSKSQMATYEKRYSALQFNVDTGWLQAIKHVIQ